MLIYNQRKTIIIANIRTIDDFFDFVKKNNILEYVISYDKILKYLINHEKMNFFLDNDILIAKRLFFKEVIIPTIDKTRLLTLKNDNASSLYFKGYSFEYIQKYMGDQNSKHSFVVNKWLNKGYKKEKAIEIAKKSYDDLNFEFQSLHSCFNKLFWMERGYTEEESIEKVREIQSGNSVKYTEKYTKDERKKFSPTCIEFYLEKGYTEQEAKNAVSERQRTFTLDKCIEKHGEEKGKQIWKRRQEKWQNTLNSKSIIEKEIINKSKGKTREQLEIKFGKEKANEIIRSKTRGWLKALSNTKFRKSSKESLARLIYPLLSEMIKRNIDINQCFYGADDKIEFGLKKYSYDFTIYDKKIIIEYHGSLWHVDPNLTEKEIEDFNKNDVFGRDYDIMKEKDEIKRKLATENGFEYYEVWDHHSDDYINFIINEVCEKCLLK